MKHIGSIRVDPQSKRETLEQMTAEFPFQANYCDLHDFPGNLCPWHWHRELEIFYIREGRLSYHLPSGTIDFEAGEGGFINSNVLHKTTCREEDPCMQEEQQFTPEFIGGFADSAIMRKYVTPLLEMPGLDIIKLTPDDPEQKKLLSFICNAFELCRTMPEGYELQIRDNLSALWLGLYRMIDTPLHKDTTPLSDHRIKQMLSYISAHYSERLTLEDIAAAAFMSPRACGRCFHAQLGTTPMLYLMEFRVQKACELLSSTSQSIGDIAMNCGFGSSSYFGRIFHEKMGMTPNEYRKTSKNAEKQVSFSAKET